MGSCPSLKELIQARIRKRKQCLQINFPRSSVRCISELCPGCFTSSALGEKVLFWSYIRCVLPLAQSPAVLRMKTWNLDSPLVPSETIAGPQPASLKGLSTEIPSAGWTLPSGPILGWLYFWHPTILCSDWTKDPTPPVYTVHLACNSEPLCLIKETAILFSHFWVYYMPIAALLLGHTNISS